MTTTDRSTVVGVFQERTAAEKAMDELRQAGFSNDQIGFAVRGENAAEGNLTSQETKIEAGEGAVAGGVIGGVVGAAAALLIPGFGPAIAGGILLATLGGVVIGAAAGGLIGALVGLGVPEEEAQFYQSEFEGGRTIVTVRAADRQNDALAILRRNGATDANSRFGQSVDPDFISDNRTDANVHSQFEQPVGTAPSGSFYERPVEPGMPGVPGTPFEQESQDEPGEVDYPNSPRL